MRRFFPLILGVLASAGCAQFGATPAGHETTWRGAATPPSPLKPSGVRGSRVSGYAGAAGGIATGGLSLDDGAIRLASSSQNPDGFATVFAGAEVREAALALAVEGEFTPTRVDTLEASVGNTLRGSMRVTHAWFVSLLPGIHVTDTTRLYGRLGVGQVNAEGNAVVNGTTYTLSDTLTAAKLGAGITHDLGSNVFVRAEYAYHRTERTDALRIQYATFGLGVGMLF